MPKLTLSVNAVIQTLGTAAQIINYSAGVVPPKAQPWLAAFVGIIQAVTGLLAHYKNPDGTAATTAYVAPTSTTGM